MAFEWSSPEDLGQVIEVSQLRPSKLAVFAVSLLSHSTSGLGFSAAGVLWGEIFLDI